MGTGGSALPIFLFSGLLVDHGSGERKLVLFLSASAEILTPQKGARSYAKNKRHVKQGSKF